MQLSLQELLSEAEGLQSKKHWSPTSNEYLWIKPALKKLVLSSAAASL